MAGLISESVLCTLHQEKEMQARKSGGMCEGPVVVTDLTSPHHQTCVEGEAVGDEASSLSITSISTTCDAPPLTPSKTQVVLLKFILPHMLHAFYTIYGFLCIILIFRTMYTVSKYFFISIFSHTYRVFCLHTHSVQHFPSPWYHT